MTHSIDKWHRPQHVSAVQTTCSLIDNHDFDVHPNRANTDLIQKLKEEFDLPHSPYFLKQTHGNRVIKYSNKPHNNFSHEADACFTVKKDVICAVMTADCLPVLLTDSIGSFVAAVHCGWRSLYSNILTLTLNQINSEHPILAWFGPCIQQNQYQVDEQFVKHYLAQFPTSHQAFTLINNGKSYACLQSLAKLQLLNAGVTQVEISNQCTYLNSEYYSWRENKTNGRMATLVWMTK